MTTTYIGAATGSLLVSGDNDWFAITLQAGTEYLFNIGNGSLSDPAVTIYNGAGTALSSASGGGVGGPSGENSQLAFVPTTTGTYYVGASSLSGLQTGNFAIQAYSASFDFAPNTSTTGALTIGGSVAGSISSAGQNDWFKVSLTAGKEYIFNVGSGSLASSGGELVTLYNSNGAYIQSGSDFESLSGGQVTYIPTASGSFYVGVSGMSGNTGSFTLTAATGTFDFGDTPATAGTVSVGGSASGVLATAQQRDWFGVTLQAGTLYSLAVSGGTLGGNATVALYNSAGVNLVPQISGGASNGAEQSFVPTTTGTYYVEAGGLIGATGTFTVAVGTASDAAVSTVNTLGTLAVGNPVSSSLTLPGESNWFKATLTAGSSYAFTLSDGTLSGAMVSVYNAAGTLVSQNTANGSAAAQVVFAPTSSGSYFVGAAASLANIGSYTLSETAVPTDYFGNVNTAGSILVGGKVTGNIANVGQSDWFKVALTAGKQYVFDINGALGNAEVTLYGSTGTEIATGGNETSFAPTSSGTYYVGAASSTGATGSFTLSAATYSGNFAANSTTTGLFTSAAQEVSSFQAGTLKSANAISDSLANVAANLDGLEHVAAAGLLTSITLTDSIVSVPTLTLTAAQFDSDYSVLNLIKSPYTLSISGFSAGALSFIQNTQNQGVRYLPGTSHAGSNQVIEIASVGAGASTVALGSGYNAVIIDGAHSTTAATGGAPDSFSFNVQSNGTVTLLDNNTGNSEQITGASYLIFNGAASNPDGSFQSIYFVEGSTNAYVTALYNAAFLRQPDLAGLEYYAAPLATGALSLHQAATFFLNSPEFLSDYPTAAAAPDNGGPHDQAYITTLYQNVLNRTPAAFELSYYANVLATGVEDRATLLINFAQSPENQSNISNFLVNTNNGAFADSTALLSASVVAADVTSGGVLNTSVIDPTTIGSGVTVNGITISAGAVTLSSAAPTETVDLSATIANATIANSGSTVLDSAANSVITVTGSNTALSLGHGGVDTVNLLGGTNTSISGFSPGSGTTLTVANSHSAAAVQILDGSQAPVSSLDFTTGVNYVVNVGNVGSGSAAAVATAANAAYTVSDFNGTTTPGEHLTFMGLTSGGNTVLYFFGATTGVANGIVPTATLQSSADINHNHLVDANEITLVATLVGVAPSALSAADLA